MITTHHGGTGHVYTGHRAWSDVIREVTENDAVTKRHAQLLRQLHLEGNQRSKNNGQM